MQWMSWAFCPLLDLLLNKSWTWVTFIYQEHMQSSTSYFLSWNGEIYGKGYYYFLLEHIFFSCDLASLFCHLNERGCEKCCCSTSQWVRYDKIPPSTLQSLQVGILPALRACTNDVLLSALGIKTTHQSCSSQNLNWILQKRERRNIAIHNTSQ